MFMGATNAPALSKRASSLADSVVKLPEIMPLPPVIGEFMLGALKILLSKTIASLFPILFLVASANNLAPTSLKDILTEGWLY